MQDKGGKLKERRVIISYVDMKNKKIDFSWDLWLGNGSIFF
jgi:hypothetical protein